MTDPDPPLLELPDPTKNRKGWVQKQRLSSQMFSKLALLTRSKPKPEEPSPKYLRISNCHNFAWSQQLWRDSSLSIIGTAVAMLMLYITVAALLAFSDGLQGLDIFYFIAACVTTAGLGDISPQSQLHRAASIITLPFGLIILSLCLAADEAWTNSAPRPPEEAEEEGDVATIRKEKSRKFMEKWYKKKEQRGAKIRRVLLKIALKYVAILSVGIIFFMTNNLEQKRLEDNVGVEMTFVDAAFFSTVVSTSVGYGHLITPQTGSAKAFLTFYFFAAILIGKLVGDLAGINSQRNESIVESEIVHETTWVHKTAMLSRSNGEVTEAEYLIFKLLQLQKVDEELLGRLQTRFDELDTDGQDGLNVGTDIPSSDQIAEITKLADSLNLEATEDFIRDQWDAMRTRILLTRRDSFVDNAAIKAAEEGNVEAAAPKAFPEAMGALKIVDVAPDFIASSTSTDLYLKMDHPAIVPLIPALAEGVVSLELGPLSIIQVGAKTADIHPKAASFAFTYNTAIDVARVAPGGDVFSGPGMVMFFGAFVYFDKNENVVDIKSFGMPPPVRSILDTYLDFGAPQPLPEIAQEALGDRLHDVTLDFLKDAGAVAFAWINRAEPLPGIAPQPAGAFAYILENGEGIFFPIKLGGDGFRPKVSEIHNFDWSRQLWYGVFKQTVAMALFSLFLYIFVGFQGICRIEGWTNSESWYFLSVSFATVGYGDFAPTKQFTRGVAIGLLPFGLIVVGLAISASNAYALSKEFDSSSSSSNGDWRRKIEKVIQNQGALVDMDDDGKITREEMVQMSKALKMTEDMAGELFDKLDEEKKGYIERLDLTPKFSAIIGRLLILTFHVYWPVVLNAVFFKIPALGELIFGSELKGQSMTWIDSLYFATVSSTTIGFGDITPQTKEGQLFMAVYIFFACVFVGYVLREFIALYVYNYIGDGITETIINSTTWIHKADLLRDGVINMPEFLLFKLQELQKVEKKTLDVLMARFVELDTGDDLALNVGFDIPSAEQVAKLQSQVSWWNPKSKTLMEAWEEMQKEVKTVAKRKEVYQTNLERWAKMRKKPAPPAEEVEESKKPDPPSAEEAEESEPSQQIVSNRISRSKTAGGKSRTNARAGADDRSQAEFKDGRDSFESISSKIKFSSSKSTASSKSSSTSSTPDVLSVSAHSSRTVSPADLGEAQSSTSRTSGGRARKSKVPGPVVDLI